MPPFKLEIHRVTDPFTGQETHPDQLRLTCGNKTIAFLWFNELVEAIEEYQEFKGNPDDERSS